MEDLVAVAAAVLLTALPGCVGEEPPPDTGPGYGSLGPQVVPTGTLAAEPGNFTFPPRKVVFAREPGTLPACQSPSSDCESFPFNVTIQGDGTQWVSALRLVAQAQWNDTNSSVSVRVADTSGDEIAPAETLWGPRAVESHWVIERRGAFVLHFVAQDMTQDVWLGLGAASPAGDPLLWGPDIA